MSDVRKAPALAADKSALHQRTTFDYSDYGFVISASATAEFEIVPVRADDEEAFVLFYYRRDLEAGRFCLFNLHCFLKRIGGLDDFAHSLGPSVRTVELVDTVAWGLPARTYTRVITMRDLFEGAPAVIDFIGGSPDLVVTDSHTYLRHRHGHYYSGMLHDGVTERLHYRDVRERLLRQIKLV